jgi:hypothetical protein
MALTRYCHPDSRLKSRYQGLAWPTSYVEDTEKLSLLSPPSKGSDRTFKRTPPQEQRSGDTNLHGTVSFCTDTNFSVISRVQRPDAKEVELARGRDQLFSASPTPSYTSCAPSPHYILKASKLSSRNEFHETRARRTQ